MLDFSQVKAQYPKSLQQFEKGILREYLQYKILQGIFESKFASKVSFLGGTALRIIYGNTRFSEDIDLDNFGLNWDDFSNLIDSINAFLLLEGFEIEISKQARSVYHCEIKFPRILYEHGISPLTTQKILIKLDTYAQGYDYSSDISILNKFDVFTEVRVTPLPILLSQKIYAAINRKRTQGRDFYDITFLLSMTKPDYGYLDQKLGISSPENLREYILTKIKNFDFKVLAEDVAPFLIRKQDVQRVTLFRTFWMQTPLN